MIPIYEKTEDMFEIFHKTSCHISPHLHSSIEMVYVTAGTLEIGIGEELYHMEQGDFAIVFPDLIHHYQVFDSGNCTGIYILASSSLSGMFSSILVQSCPVNPVIPKEKLHPDVTHAVFSLFNNPAQEYEQAIHQSLIQLILARSLPYYSLIDKTSVGSHDFIYETISYIAGHFKGEITLTSMAKDLGYSPYTLSRVFSNTFHRNFNQYLNEIRLDYACRLLQYTDQSITEAYENAGFNSQRTFNRAFLDRYRMSPREYRKQYKK